MHFPFDGSLTDAGGNYTFTANTGVTTNFVEDRFGNAGKAYSTPVDVNQELGVQIPTLLPQGNDERTISFWVKKKANNHSLNLVSYGDGSNNFGIGTENKHMKIDSWTINNVFPELQNQEHAQWGQVVVTYSQAITKVYYNGREVFTSPTVLWNTAGNLLYLNYNSTNWNSNESGFTLTYDDLKIYDVALTEAQIIENLLEDNTLETTNLMGYFDFENDLNEFKDPNINFEGMGTYVSGHTTGSIGLEFNSSYNQFHKTNSLDGMVGDNITLGFWRKRLAAPQQLYETDIEIFGSLFLRENSNNLVMGILSGTGGGSYRQAVMPKSTYNVWEHYTVVFKMVAGERFVYMYRDGVLRGWVKLVNNTPMLKFTDLVTIGTGTDVSGNNSSDKKASNLQMDNLYIFNRALTETEIMALAFQDPADFVYGYNINATVNPSNAGTITGVGNYDEGDSVTLTATASNADFNFVEWTENGTQVSTDAMYSFTSTEHRDLVAEFQYTGVNVNIPDPAFKSHLVSLYDTNGDGEISYPEAEAVTGQINASNQNISDLTGLEAFINLTSLDISGNSVTSIDLNNLVDLKKIYVTNNNLTELDLSQNPEVYHLEANYNQISSLDLSNNPLLELLHINHNGMKFLNLQNTNNPGIDNIHAEYGNSFDCILVEDMLYAISNWSGYNPGVLFHQNNRPFKEFCEEDCIVHYQRGHNQSINGISTNAVAADFIVTEPIMKVEEVIFYFNNNSASYDAEVAFFFDYNNTPGALAHGPFQLNPSYIAVNDKTKVKYNLSSENVVLNGNGTKYWVSISTPGVSNALATSNGIKNGTYAHLSNDNYATWSSSYLSNLDVAFAVVGDCNVSVPSFDITTTANPSHAGTVAGAGTYNMGASATLTATGNNYFDFVRWTENGTQVSTNATYTFTVTEDRDLVAEFESNGLYVYIPDPAFKNYLLGQSAINTTNDGEISFAEAAAFTGTINCTNRNISDLTGIEAFINLTSLNCWYNNLTSIDLSANTELTYLKVSNNQLTALDLSNNSKITHIEAKYNEIASIDLGTSPEVKWIEMNDNELTSIDLSTAFELISVEVNNNNLTSLDVSNNPELIQIQCDNNQISSLDVRQNPLLAHLWIQNNQMTELDLRNGRNSTTLGQIKAANNNLSCVQVDNEVYSTAHWTNPTFNIEFDAGVIFSEFCYDDCTINHRRALSAGSAGDLQVRTMAADFVITSPNMKLEELQFHLVHSQPTDAEIAIFTDNNGQPGTMIHGPLQVSPTSEVHDSNPVNSYKVSFDISSENIILSGNGTKYWISIATPNQNNAWRPAQVVGHNTNIHYTTDNYQTWVEWVHTDGAFNILGDCNVTVSTYDIVATANPTNGGTITGAGSYVTGASVNLTATANLGYEFVRWTENGTQVSTSATYSFTASADRTLVAEFAIKSYTIAATASPSAGGSITGDGTFDHGDTVSLTATANAGYDFVRWTENGTQVSTSATYSFTADANRTLVAEFSLITYTIAATASPSAGGTIFGVGNFTHGASVSLTASPNSGYIFVRWTENGTQVSTSANYSFTADADRTLITEFELKAYAITAAASPSAGGSVAGAGTYDAGDSVSLTAIANAGYNFVRWTENGTQVSTSATYTFAAHADRTLVAEFDLIPVVQYTISASANPSAGGTITGAGTYDAGDSVSLTAAANAGYDFVRWTENGTQVSTSATYTFTANANRTLVAEIDLIPIVQYTISASANPSASGTITGAGTYDAGDSVSLTATANAGYNFVRWTENGTQVSTSATYSFTANANRTLVAEFDLIPIVQYTISASANPSAGGTITGAGTYDAGDSVSLTATANAGYDFVRWTENGTQVSTSATYSFTANANRTLVAEFALKSYTIAASANPSAGGSVAGAGTYDHGDSVSLTAAANAGYDFVRWTENGAQVSTSATYSFTASADRTLVAEFALKSYVISASANPSAGGSITGAGTYDHGDSVSLTATANANYDFVRWTENGTQVSTSATYTFTANANRTLVAEFALKSYVIAASANPSAGGSITGAGTYDHGDSVSLTAAANAGYDFVRWTENGAQVSTSATYSFTASADRTLVAEFDSNLPLAPTKLTARAEDNPLSVELAWIDNSSDEDGFVLERSLDSNNFTQIATLNANEVTYTDLNVDEETTYFYRVYAFNSEGNSAYSNLAQVTTGKLGVNDFAEFKLSLYPNPATDMLNIETENIISSIEIYNFLGQKVMTSTQKTIDVSTLSTGTYMIKITDKNNLSTSLKFVKK